MKFQMKINPCEFMHMSSREGSRKFRRWKYFIFLYYAKFGNDSFLNSSLIWRDYIKVFLSFIFLIWNLWNRNLHNVSSYFHFWFHLAIFPVAPGLFNTTLGHWFAWRNRLISAFLLRLAARRRSSSSCWSVRPTGHIPSVAADDEAEMRCLGDQQLRP